MFYWVTMALLTVLSSATSSEVPTSPCPGVLEYLQGASGGLFAQINAHNDLSDSFTLLVNLAVSDYDSNDFAIKLDTCEDCLRNGEVLHYYLILQRDGIIPTVTAIKINNKTVCSTNSTRDPLLRDISLSHNVSIAKSLVRRQVSTSKTLNTSYDVLNLDSNATSEKLELSSKNNVSSLPQLIHDSEGKRSENVATNNRFTASDNSSFIQNSEIELVCGTTEESDRILNGQETHSRQYPWLVAMFSLDDHYKFRCGGTLVSDRHVFTAAHCFINHNSELAKDQIQIVLGRHDIHQWALRSTLRGVVNYYIHPDYSKASGDADIAVMVLDQSVTFSDVVKPICLWKGSDVLNDIVGQQGFVAGWGLDKDRHELVPVARQFLMPVVSQENCLRSNFLFVSITSNRTFCAGNNKGDIPCSGDGGSGFVIFKDGRWYLRGITSITLANAELTCDPHNYVVFADVPKYNSWLRNVLIEIQN